MISLILIISANIIVHELAHFFVAKAFKINVFSVQLFMYPLFYIYVFKTLFKIGFVPLIGYVNAPGINTESKQRQIVYYSAGIVANAALLPLCNSLGLTIGLLLITMNVLPFKNSDGRKIIKALRKRD